MVDIRVEARPLLLIFENEIFRRKNLFFLMRIAAKVKIVVAVNELLRRIRSRFVKPVRDDRAPILEPFPHGVKMLGQDRLGFREMFVPFGHVESVELRLFCRAVAIEKEKIRRNRRVRREFLRSP